MTDAVAPGYSQIIKYPMDFSTIKAKNASGQYKHLREFRQDFQLMTNNCMTYNNQDTIYYKVLKVITRNLSIYYFILKYFPPRSVLKLYFLRFQAARRILSIGQRLLSQDRLIRLREQGNLMCMRELTQEMIGFDIMADPREEESDDDDDDDEENDGDDVDQMIRDIKGSVKRPPGK